MRLQFPESVRELVQKLNQNDIQIMADFIPDELYNHLTVKFVPDFNGASSDSRRLAEDPNAKPTVKY